VRDAARGNHRWKHRQGAPGRPHGPADGPHGL
jgi:hypothetical protein